MAYSKSEKDRIFSIIIDRVANGESVRNVLLERDMPSSSTFFNWVDEDQIKSKQYARSLELRAEEKFQSIESDYMEEPQRDPTTGKIDGGWVQLQRLKIDAKKWELSKLHPKKYGDRLELDNKHSGSVNIISLGSGKKPE
jgi:hypothetical protein